MANPSLVQPLSSHQLDLMLQPLERLFTLPPVAARLIEQAQSDPQELPALAMLDPALCLRTMRLQFATSASPSHEVLLQELLATPTIDRPLLSHDQGELPGPEMWTHFLAVAVLTRELTARVRPDIEPSIAFACGLLHDCGKLAAMLCVPKGYQRALERAAGGRVELAQAEREVLGADHVTIGYRLAQQWQLPDTVADAVWLHHQPAVSVPLTLPNRDVVLAVSLADRLARQQGMGFAGNAAAAVTDEALLAHFGLTEGSLAELLEQARVEIAALASRLGLDQPHAPSRYAAAIAGIARTLAARNAQLMQEQSQLQAQSRAFALLSELSRSLSAEARVSDVLPRVAQISQAALATPEPSAPVVAYAIDPATQQVLAVRVLQGQPQWRVMPASQGERSPSPAMLPVAAEELEDWLAGAAIDHRPLVCAGRWVGGIILPGQARAAAGGEVADAVASWLAFALAIVQGRGRAAELSEQLAGASQVLAAAQEALSSTRTLAAVGEMAAGAAHELNNPLAIISGRSQLMLRKASTDEDRRLWQTMADQAQKLSDIITELMDFASPAAPQPADLDAAELLQAAADEFQSDPQAAASTVDIQEGQAPVWVHADRQQVLSVLRELLRNAATAADGKAAIHLAAHADDEGRVTLIVADDGPGMEPAVAAKAFTPFFSQQRAGRRRGLGLPRARRVIEANGGAIELRSTPGRGTTVSLELPAAQEPPEEKRDAPGG